MKAARNVVCVAFVAAMAVGCAKTESEATTSRPLETVRISASPTLTAACEVIGKKEGYFKDEGIDLELVRMDVNTALIAMASGSLDVIVTPIRSGPFNMIARGTAFKIVADGGHSEPGPCSPDAFAAGPDLADRVARTGLRGKRIALIKGGIMEFLTDRLLAEHHLRPADVEFVEFPPGDVMVSQNRKLDAIRYYNEPSLSVQVNKGMLKVIETTEQVAPGQQVYVVGFGNRFLNEDRDLGRRFMRAWLRSVRRYNEGKTERNVSILSAYTNLPPEVIRRACWRVIASDGEIRPEAARPLIDWARKRGYLEADMPPSRWWDPSFIDAANRDLATRPAAATTEKSR